MSDRAVRISQAGGPEVLTIEPVQVGDPGPGEIRIRHAACGLNYIDIYHRSGVYPLPLPSGLGMEGAGIVEAVGEGVTHLRPGDRAAYASQPIGAYATARVMPARCVVKLPDFLSFEQGAAMMLKGMTVQYLLRRTLPQGGLQPGDHVLFHAAAGGVGLIACQWAKALGLRLIATAGSDAKCRLALDHGAEFAINYATENFAERVKEITGGRGVKVVYDSVGASTWEGSLASLRPFGLMVSFGNASGVVPPVALGALSAKALYLTRPSLFVHLDSLETTQEIAGDLFAAVERGAVRIEVEQRYPFDEVQRAHRELEARTTTGSGVLLV
ncbi:quinone oxidoreductase [Mitsuaria sp. TWR114]|jgi:NADPH2:quinone reductase|uniref:quinone oxidoreductase family protein n=1 Tax=unclassified Roseateles TaxID=2626991 RepID=UPI0011BE2731|nr:MULTISPECIES: quinone oxidoreductase [unclassified Roseateles]MBB3292587.1 NADPH2:quinone reductase [Mitsuaria sp. BK041]MBB3361804.1 NADPH2:quinone reductase [Mitsuaria sp. BK045]TXD91846.1 quinone oxidoreductase [Mitsuaria sp. TWR114]